MRRVQHTENRIICSSHFVAAPDDDATVFAIRRYCGAFAAASGVFVKSFAVFPFSIDSGL
jgi:hypothetical protein